MVVVDIQRWCSESDLRMLSWPLFACASVFHWFSPFHRFAFEQRNKKPLWRMNEVLWTVRNKSPNKKSLLPFMDNTRWRYDIIDVKIKDVRTTKRKNSNNKNTNQRVIEYEAQVRCINNINSSTSKSIEMDPLRIDIFIFILYGPLSMCVRI